MSRKIFVTGNGTDVGKTIVSAILCEALRADYWKPVQAGNLGSTDTDFMRSVISNDVSVIHPETFRLTQAMSPHAAAKIDGIKIKLKDFSLPQTKNTLIIEGAGGLLVPLNQKKFVVDLIMYLKAETIIVCSNYLGSINHSLLTIEAAKRRDLKITGIVFNGEPNSESESIILKHSGMPLLGNIFSEKEVNRETILKYVPRFVRV